MPTTCAQHLGFAASALSGAALPMNLWILARARPYLYAAAAAVPARPVAIVLGCAVDPGGEASPQLADRCAAALALLEAGRCEWALLSGAAPRPGKDEVAAMRRWLTARGVAPERLVDDRLGVRTLATMQRARAVYGVASAVVCTQRYHLPRSVFLARRAGLDAVGLQADGAARYEGAVRDEAREVVARAVAFLDTYVLGTRHR